MKINKKFFLIVLLPISVLTGLNVNAANDRICKDGERSYFDVCPEDNNSRQQPNEKVEGGATENKKTTTPPTAVTIAPTDTGKQTIALPPSKDIVNAENVTEVDAECGDGHHLWFKDSDGTNWKETNDAQNKTYSYKYVSNDKWSLKIQHVNVTVVINLRQKKVFWSRGDQNFKCSITKAK